MSASAPLIESAKIPVIEGHPEEIHRPFPLTDLQHAYWIGRSAAFELGQVAGRLCFEFETEKLFDMGRLTAAFNRLIERHAMLRAVVRPDGLQQILTCVPAYDIEVLDLRGKAQETVELELTAMRERVSNHIGPADQWPLFDVRAAQLDGRIRLHLSFDLLMVDFTSFGILLNEWSLLYENPDAALPPINLCFRDYVLASNALEQSDIYQTAKAYWQNRLQDLAPAPELPMARSRAISANPKFKRRASRLPADVWQQFKESAVDAGLTPSSALLAAFCLVIGRWSKHQRFTLDITLFNRIPCHQDVNRLVGDFTSNNILPVSNLFEGSFADFGNRLQEQVWQDMEHRHFSGVRVLREWASLHRGSPRRILPVVFTSAIGLFADEQAPWSWLGEIVYGATQTPQVFLDHILFIDRGALVLNWDVVEELFPAGMVEEMFTVYNHLLRRLATDPSCWQVPVQELNRTLLPTRQLQLRQTVNSTQAPVPEGWLHSRFARQVRQRPDHPALITPEHTLSYQQLFRLANQLAHRLRRDGVQPNTLVAVAMEKGWEQVVAVLGILTAGAAYLPIDPTLPQERIAYLLQHGQAQMVLTQPHLAPLTQRQGDLRQITVTEAELAQEPDTWLEPVQKTSDLAYVIYTSGSTGLPKGVMISHQAALNTLVDINQRFAIQAEDRILGLSSLSFDLSVYDVLGSLAAGATLVLPRPGTMRDPAHWAELMTSAGVTVWNSVPALMEMLVEYASGRSITLPLRLVMLSGDWIPVSLPARLWQWMPGVELISLGGATEAAIWSILYPIERVDATWESIPYGKPMVNQSLHVLNEALEACPEWVPGQLYIGGVGLAEGYWRDEEKTRGSFVQHPRTGERLYRTGDLGRYLPDGNIEFLGREDFQVKVHGHRIELGEIEVVLAQHPQVRTAVVAAVGENRSHKRLVAYIVPNSTDDVPDLISLQDFMAAKLPDYMVPSDVIVLEQLPLSANGKVDRRALPQPDVEITEPRPDSQSADIIDKLAAIFARVLGLPEVGIDKNFFEMGGDSILGIQAINQAREQGLEITPQQIFEYQTITELAAVVTTISEGPQQGLMTGEARLTAFQRWLLGHHPRPESMAQVLVLEPNFAVDPILLEKAFQQLQLHHDALRLRFHKVNQEWKQTHACANGILPLTRIAAPALSGRKGLDTAIAELQAHLSLDKSPVVLGFVESGSPRVLWLIHELLVDGVSWKILLSDLETAYNQLSQGEEVRLTPKTMSFKKAADHVGNPTPDLAGFALQPGAASTLIRRLEVEHTAALFEQISLIYNTRISEVLLTALAQTFAAERSNSALSLDTETSVRSLGQENSNLERTVGCFTSLARKWLDLKGVFDPETALKSIKEQVRSPQNNSSGTPQVVFSYFDVVSKSRPGHSSWGAGANPERLMPLFPHSLQIHCETDRNSLQMRWTFDPQTHDVVSVQKIADSFCDHLVRLVQHSQSAESPAYSPSDFPEAAVSQEELDKFLTLLGKSTGGGL